MKISLGQPLGLLLVFLCVFVYEHVHADQRTVNVDTVAFDRVLASFRMACKEPIFFVVGDKELPWPAAYFRTPDDRNLIKIRESVWTEGRVRQIVMHELFHCALLEDRRKYGYPDPKGLDPREEMVVQALTSEAMGRF